MSEVLSQDEIDQLLTAINAGDNEPEAYKPAADSRRIKIYDFKRPDKFSKEQIRTFAIMYEQFSRLAVADLSAQLRSIVHIRVASVDQLTYEEFIRSIPTPTTITKINMDPLKGNAILEIDPTITFSIIDRICGGSGDETKSQHELTEIEQNIMEDIIIRMLGNLREAWAELIDLRPRLGQIDTNPIFVQIATPEDMSVLITMEARIGSVEGMINFCIPYLTIEPIMGKLSPWSWYNTMARDYSTPVRDDIPITLIAEILRRDYPLNEILGWDVGTVILPLRPLSPGFCFLRLGNRRVWQCQILPDRKWFFKRITIIGYAEKPFGTEGNDMDNNVNSLVKNAVYSARMTVSVELGAASKTVREVFAMGEGTIIELDKLAGEPVDVKANGVYIAKGEVVVIDEIFGIRVNKIIVPFDAFEQSEKEEPAPETEAPEPGTGEAT
jgi:flagellar motor switch protein FliM